MSSTSHLLLSKFESILTITLNREEARNAYSDEMIDALVDAFDEAEADSDVKCVIITGAGTTFSAGGDLNAMKNHSGMFEGDAVNLRSRYMRGIQRIPRRMARFEKPVVAAINGPAIGAGRFGSTFVKLGLIPGDGGAYLLSRTIGVPRALDLILTGRLIDTMEAERMGLINEAVEPEQLMATARKRALRIAANAPQAGQISDLSVVRPRP